MPLMLIGDLIAVLISGGLLLAAAINQVWQLFVLCMGLFGVACGVIGMHVSVFPLEDEDDGET